MKNILILTYWSYPEALVQTYTLPYVRIIKKNLPPGSSVFLLTLEKNPDTLKESERDVITTRLKAEGIQWLPFTYRPFGWAAFLLWIGVSLKLCLLIIRKKIAVIHCWCTPPGAIGYLLSVLLNRTLVLDSYEPHAETMVENGTWKKESLAFRLLFWFEKKQTQRAQFVISATSGMRDYARKKYKVDIKNFYVKPACVNLKLFSENNLKGEQLLKTLDWEEKIVCVYAGKFGGIYLDLEIFDFLKVAFDYWGDSFRILLLTNHTSEEIELYCRESGLPSKIVTIKFVDHQEVPNYMGLADFAMTPVKPIPTKRYCTPIKDGEYWALGLPVVISDNISDDSEIIEANNAGVVLKSLNPKDYEEAVLKLDTLLQQPGLRNRIRSLAKQYRSFDIAERVYQEVYQSKNG